MKIKIVVLLAAVALLVGVLSGCVEEKPTTPTNTAPEALFEASSTTPAIGEDITFTDGSSDDDGDTLTYSWDFGDDSGTSAESSPIYNYSANGTYTVTLTVNDGTEDSTAYTMTVIVGNVAPTASFTYVATNLSVVFTDASTDPNGASDITAWSWDFDDDDVADNTTQGPVTYEYTAAGSYNVTLTVTDTYGEQGTYTEEITITE